MLHLGSADAERQRAEGAVSGGVGVAADDGGAGQGDAELGAHHMDDPLIFVVEIVEANPERLAVIGERLHLDAGHLAGGGDVLGGGGDVVIHGGPGQVRAAQLAVHGAQAVKCLRAGHFMHQMAVDVDEGGLPFHFPYHVGVEYFLIEGLGHCFSLPCFLLCSSDPGGDLATHLGRALHRMAGAGLMQVGGEVTLGQGLGHGLLNGLGGSLHP